MNSKLNITLQSIVALIVLITLFVAIMSYKTAERASQTAEQTKQILEQNKQILEQTNQILEQTNQVLEQNKQILERTYEVLYRSNLPVISAVSEIYYDEEKYLWTEKITVYNGGGPTTEFGGYAEAIMSVWFPDRGLKTYIPLRGYFINPKYSGNTQNLLLTIFVENHLSYYWSISSDFGQAAFEDGYESFIRSIYILNVHYWDYTGKYCSGYFEVSSVGSRPMEEAEAREILDSADRNGEIANNRGLSLYIWSLSGRDLWNWYKEEILQD